MVVFIGLLLEINNEITIVFIQRAAITQNPISITLPISISRFSAFTNPVGDGHGECTAGQTSPTTVRIYCYVSAGNLEETWYNSILCIGY